MNKKRLTKTVCALLLGIFILLLCGFEMIECKLTPVYFEDYWVTTEDGFVYYVDDKIGLCIVGVPDSEELVIPEYIDGHRVAQLGYKYEPFMNEIVYWIEGSHVKKLTIQHQFEKEYIRYFTNLELVVYVDFTYCNMISSGGKEVRAWNTLDPQLKLSAEVFLVKSDRIIDNTAFPFDVIRIPEYVTIIEEGVFDGLENVTIKTPLTSKPDGWEDGWNGTCAVEWAQK